MIGTVSEVTNDGLGISFPGGDSQSISYGEMESLHRSIGRRSYRKRSALIGAGAGVLLGISTSSTSESCDDDFVDDLICDSVGFLGRVFVGVALGAGGALAGVIVGSFIKGERWQEVFVPGMGSIRLEPRVGMLTNGRPAIGVQMVF